MTTLAPAAHEPLAIAGPDFLQQLLSEQQQLSAIEQFSRVHDCHPTPAQEKYYRDLIPLSAPRPGEQYAFEVDLDTCSGCKACVVACHNLNGLEEAETWRSVGLLTGGNSQAPVMQHVTSACHHCVEPACLQGCPVKAYVKDPMTGIVRHLDDQCIGCQYCILKCPYDVPKYSATKGIVRKCDMCHDRLAVGEAPACVQACPNQAIRITVVNKQAVTDESESDLFLPGAAAPSYTLPTTVFRSRKPLPRNVLPADYYTASPQHAHLPLVVMLVLTQMSVGAFAVEQALRWLLPEVATSEAQRQLHLITAFGLGALGLVGSLFHLGRPRYAYRALIGLRTSWLSREILGFSVFAGFASLYAGLPWLPGCLSTLLSDETLGVCVVVSGIAALGCSVMVYASTNRPYWNWTRTTVRFLLSAAWLGLPVSLLLGCLGSSFAMADGVVAAMLSYGRTLCGVLVIVAAAKLVFEAAVFTHLFSRTLTPLKRTALLMRGDLRFMTARRFLAGVFGGILLPSFLWLRYEGTPTLSPAATVLGIIGVFLLSIVGELLERYLFFSAVMAPKMPGTSST